MSAVTRKPLLLLDGLWDFQLLDTPTEAPSQDWRPIQVPMPWTMQDVGDIPIYTASRVPVDSRPPRAPKRNPTGVYRRVFDMPTFDLHERVLLRVGAAEGVLLASLNGHELGVSKDSRLEADFDVTDALRAEDNELILTVVRWSDSTYLENQDRWWHAGLTRSVWLYTRPRTGFEDIGLSPGYEVSSGTGVLKVTATVSGARDLEPGWSVRTSWLSDDGRVVGAHAPVSTWGPPPTLGVGGPEQSGGERPAEASEAFHLWAMKSAGEPLGDREGRIAEAVRGILVPRGEGLASVTSDPIAVTAWSAEVPHLYSVTVELLDPSGCIVDETLISFGFRDVRVDGKHLLVNGQPVLIQGVNRHDFDPRGGSTVPREKLEETLALLKRFNFNAIRTAHYPTDPCFYELCDRMGFFVVDEANVEAHQYQANLCRDPAYLPAFVDRVSRMVIRDKNHPCVIAWSLGNESGYGPNHDAAAGWIRHYDPSRPLHYEGAIMGDWHSGHRATDVVCPMYASAEAIVAFAEDPRADRPLVMSEYSHAMGNSNGDLAQFWEAIEETDGLQGGFIWELQDHGLDPQGSRQYRYGGDFGDTPNDAHFCIDGLLFPDGSPHPAMYEARALFAPVAVSVRNDPSSGILVVRNRGFFTDLRQYTFGVRVALGEKTLAEIAWAVPAIAPRDSSCVPLPDAVVAQLHGGEVMALHVVVRLASDQAWAPAGTVMAELPVDLGELPVQIREGAADGDPGVDGEGRWLLPVFTASPTLELFRAPTDNDSSKVFAGRLTGSGFDAPHREVLRVSSGPGRAVTEELLVATHEVRHSRTVSVVGPGHYRVDEAVDVPPGATDLLRIGTTLALIDGYTDVEWFGLGPAENYPDRRAGALLGRWTSAIDEMDVPYVKPQEQGSRGRTQEIVLTGHGVPDIRLRLGVPLQVGVTRYSTRDLTSTSHVWQLPMSTRTFVHLDVAHRGIGSASVGPDTPARFRIGPGRFEWSFTLEIL